MFNVYKLSFSYLKNGDLDTINYYNVCKSVEDKLKNVIVFYMDKKITESDILEYFLKETNGLDIRKDSFNVSLSKLSKCKTDKMIIYNPNDYNVSEHIFNKKISNL